MARLRELIADVDVFIQGFRYGSLDRKGLGLRDMLELAASRGKGIVYVDENCYGPDGPFAERPGWQQIGDAASGSSYVMGRSLGYADEKCVLPPLPVSVRETAEKFGFVPSTPDQFVMEILLQVIAGWKKGRPGYLDEDSPLMTTFDQGPWGRQTLLKPVVRLDEEAVTPRWTTAPVPNCYHDRNINWH